MTPCAQHEGTKKGCPKGLSVMSKLQPAVVTSSQRWQRFLLNNLYHRKETVFVGKDRERLKTKK